MSKVKIDRSSKVIQTFESSRLLKEKLEQIAQQKNITLSALIREVLEKYLENREF